MTKDELSNLFQPFNRLGQESGPEEGTGIGLVVTKKLIELMGGTLGVQSTAGIGSAFWFELLASEPPGIGVDARRPDHATRLTLAEEGTAGRRKLLYVEDNPANLALVERLIERRDDLVLLTATSGMTGIALAKQYLPDVILMDINLPGMSGYGALRILRADPFTAAIPVVALSANAMPRDLEKGIEAGFFKYLTKPIMVQEFMDALDEALHVALHGNTPER